MKSIEERLIEYHGAHMAAENEVLGFPKVPVLLRVVSNEIRRLRACSIERDKAPQGLLRDPEARTRRTESEGQWET
jgi:hypothetical protein